MSEYKNVQGHDSGYGGSVDGASVKDLEPDAVAVDGELSLNRSSQSHHRSPSLTGRSQAAINNQQMAYNDNRVQLGQSITAVRKLLKDLHGKLKEISIYYPAKDEVKDARGKGKGKGKEKVKDDVAAMEGELDDDIEEHEPRLVTPQLDKELNVFKLDVKMGSLSADEFIKQLEGSSVHQLLESKILNTLKHLNKLRDRIDDTTSKVLITGDLNSGKSTFCNALLRRRVLPADQQPCTNVFCEVKDFNDNDKIEAVHAVVLGRDYNRLDETSYESFPLTELDDLVSLVDKYSILKVYLDDDRPPNQSLLRNGVVDISLIDAPGLNMDSYQTTEVFSRQEEIDLVVFVVSAENHFTLSAKEFITAAAHEKSFIFIVVNRFDNITNKGKCMDRIMNQVEKLSPETHKDSRDFVHFVSSSNRLEGTSKDGGDGGDDGDGGDGPPDPEDPNFDNLEASLRNFVLEKRSLSKLAPAKTYLHHILQDLESLASVNVKVSITERDKLLDDLKQIKPRCDKAIKENAQMSDKMERLIEDTADDVYQHATDTLTKVMELVGDAPVVEYTSLVDVLNYAQLTRQAIVEQIQQGVYDSEQYARDQTTDRVNALKSMGILHLGDNFTMEKLFHPNNMFSKTKHNLGRKIQAPLSPLDFFDIQLPLALQFSMPMIKSDSKELSVVNNAMTLGTLTAAYNIVNRSEWIIRSIGFLNYDTVKKLFWPVVIGATAASCVYIVSEIPNAIPRNLSRKVVAEVQAMGYVHSNSDRIAKECRKVLRYPASDIRNAFQRDMETRVRKKDEFEHSVKLANDGVNYFSKLQKDSEKQRLVVEKCNLSVD